VPTLIQVYFFPKVIEVFPAFVQEAPAFTAEKLGAMDVVVNPIKIQKTIAIAFLRFILILC
jgi:hypothetical protein